MLAVPPSVWNKIGIEPGAAGAARAADGHERQEPDAVEGPVLASGGARAGHLLSDGPVNWPWHQTDGQKGAGASLCAFSGASAAETCREVGAGRAQQELSRRTRQGLQGGLPAQLRAIAVHGLAGRRVDSSLLLVPPRPARSPPWVRSCVKASSRLHFAGEHACYAFVGYMEGAPTPAPRSPEAAVAARRRVEEERRSRAITSLQ